jgi:hypothetical protein
MPEPISTGAAILGGSVIGGGLSALGASGAAETQAGAARDAAALQKQMFDRQMAGQEPYRQAGLAGQTRLMELLGLSAPAQPGVGGAPYMRSDAELRNALAGQFTSAPGYITGGGREGSETYSPGGIDEAGLSRAMAAARQGDQNAMNNYQPPQVAAQQSPDFGRYARDFSLADFQKDPGYQNELDMIQQEGRIIERERARRGLLQSPGTSNALLENAQRRARQGFGEAFNRYQTNRSNQLNPLGSLMTLGQNAAANQGASMGTYGTNVGNLTMQGGQAMAAGQLGVGNTINNALGSMASSYQNQQNFTDYLNRFGNQSPVGQPSYMAPQRSDIDPYSGVRNPQGYV